LQNFLLYNINKGQRKTKKLERQKILCKIWYMWDIYVYRNVQQSLKEKDWNRRGESNNKNVKYSKSSH